MIYDCLDHVLYLFLHNIFQIIGGTTEAIAMIATTVKNTHNNVWCGRNFATADNLDFAGNIVANAEQSVCCE